MAINFSDDELLGFSFDEPQPEVTITNDWDSAISEIAQKYPNVPENVVRALIQRESSGNPYADVDTGGKWGMARGLGQFIDSTAERFIPEWKDPSDSYDPIKNIQGIYNYLNHLKEKEGSIEKALFRYHGGGTDVLGTKSDDYVKQIMGIANEGTKFNTESFSDEDLLGLDLAATEPEQDFELGGKAGTVVSTLKSIPRGIISLLETYKGSKKEALSKATPEMERISTNLEKYLKEGASDLTQPDVPDYVLKDIQTAVTSGVQTKEEAIQSYIGSLRGQEKDFSKQLDDAEKWVNIAKIASEHALVKKKDVKPADTAVGRFAQDLVGGGTQILTAMASGPAAPVVLGTMIAGGTAESVIEKGGSYENAFKAATYNSLIQMPLEMFGFGKIAGKIPKGKIAKEIFEKFGVEAVTEFLQQYSDDISVILATKEGTVKEKLQAITNDIWDITKNGFRAGLIGGIVGGGVGSVQSVMSSRTKKPDTDIGDTKPTPDVAPKPTVLDGVKPELEQFFEQATPEQIIRRSKAFADKDIREEFFKIVPEDKIEAVNALREKAVETPLAEDKDETTKDTPDATEVTEEEAVVTPRGGVITEGATVNLGTKKNPDMAKITSIDEFGDLISLEKEDGTVVGETFDGIKKLGFKTDAKQEVTKEDLVKEKLKQEPTLKEPEQVVEPKKETVEEIVTEEKPVEETKDLPVQEDKKVEEVTEPVKIPTEGQLRKTLKWGKKPTKSQQSTIGKKARKAIRVAVESKNPELIEQIRGKTVEEVAKLAETAGIAKGKVLDTKGVDVGATETKRAKQQVLNEFDNGILDHTPEAESQLKTMVNKLERDGVTVKFDDVFTVVEGKDKKVIMVENLDVFDQLKGVKQTVGLDDARVQTLTTEEGQIYKLKSTGEKGAPITTAERTKSMNSILDFVQSDKPITFEKVKFTGKDVGTDATVSQTKDAVNIKISEDVWNTGNVFDSQFHEAVGHYGAERLMSKNKRMQGTMRKAFTKIRESDYVKKIEDLYEQDLMDVVKDGGNAEDHLFYETVAHLATDLRKDYIDDSGNWIKKPTPIYKRVWETFKNFVRYISGETTDMERINRNTAKLIEAVGKQAKRERVKTAKVQEKKISKITGKMPKPQIKKADNGIELVLENEKPFVDRAKTIAKDVDGLVVQGIQNGAVGGQKPFVMARVDRGGINTNVALPVNFTKLDAEQKIQEKLSEFGVGETQVKYVRKQKSKPDPKPAKDKKTNIERYITDRVALENSTAKNFNTRLFNFVARNMGGTGSAIRSMRSQLFTTVDKMKTKDASDPNFQKAMELIDRFKDNESTKEKFDDFRRTVKSRGKFIRKVSDETLNDKIAKLNKLRNDFDEYNNLLRLHERGTVLYPYKKGTQELTNARGQYEKGLEKGTIKHVEKNGSQFYKITDKGLKLLNNIKTGETNKLLENVDNLQNDINEFKGILSQHSESVKEAKDNREKKIKAGIEGIEKQIGDTKDPPKWYKRLTDKQLKMFKQANLFHDSFRYITNKLDRFNEGAFTKALYDPLHEGRNQKNKMQDSMDEHLKKLLHDKNFTEKEILEILSKSRSYEFNAKDRHGKKSTIKLSSGEKISLAMMAKNQNALNHLTKNGFVYDNERRFIPSFSDLTNLELTEREQDMVDVLFDYYDKQADFINEVSMNDVGYKIATEDFYHPLRVANWSTDGGIDKMTTPADMNALRNDVFGFANPSSLKARTGSSKPIILEGAFDAMSRVTPSIANYYGMAIPYKQAVGVLKGVSESATESGIKTELEKLVTDVNQLVVPQGSYNSVLSFLDSINTVSALGLKMSTATLQPLSFSLVANNLGKYSGAKRSTIVKNFVNTITGSQKEITKNIHENSPMIWKRLQGYTNADIGDMLSGQKTARLEDKFLGKKFLRAKNFSPARIIGTMSEAFMAPIQFFDHVAIRGIWSLSEAEVMATGMERSDPNFQKEVAKIAEKYIVDTQPTFDPFDRPAALRATGTKKSFVKKQVFKFMSQRMKNVQLFKQGMHEIGQGKVGTGLFRMTNVMVSQYIALAAIKGLFKVARGKMDFEDEFKDLEQWVNTLMANVSDIIPIIGPAIGSMISGYKPSVIGQYDDWLSAIQLAFKDFADGEYWEGVKRVLKPGDIRKGMNEPLDILDNMTDWEKPDWMGD